MQRELFYEDPYLRGCEAAVAGCDETGVRLDATVFYPLGGGQPGDSGTLILPGDERIPILDTRRNRETGAIVHVLADGAPRPVPDTPVRLELDWPRRHRHMRMHTCLHLLSAVIKAGVTGGNLSDRGGRLDFDAAGMVLDQAAIERALQALIAADLPVRFRTISGAELRANPELIRTLSVSPPLDAPLIRLVEIEGADLQPCGGTHVQRTGEIGAVRVARIESKGARNRRVALAFAED